jgi:hypothetical protein
MGDIKFVEMPIEEIKSENGRTIIKSGGQFYSFFQTKKDGQPSRAQSDFEKLQPTIGNTYSFGITENVKQTPDGQTITFKNIVLISETRGGKQTSPEQNNAPGPQQSPPPQQNITAPIEPPKDTPGF